MRVAATVRLSDEDRLALEKWSRSRTAPVRKTVRAKIVLKAAKGLSNKRIAQELGISEQTVAT